MTSHISEEFNRILSNPENEIISHSLKERLKPQTQKASFLLTFENDIFESYLESFSLKKESFSISLNASSEVIMKILSKNVFTLTSDLIDYSISSSDASEISSFKIDGNSYILNIVIPEEVKK